MNTEDDGPGVASASSIKISTPLPSPEDSPRSERVTCTPAPDSTTPSTTTPTTKTRPQKLRQSCDPCAASKVKCSKEQPACRRCINNGRECVYLPSMRSGRARWKRKKPRSTDEDVKPAVDLTTDLGNWSPTFTTATEGSISNDSMSLDLDTGLPLDSIEIPMIGGQLAPSLYLPSPDDMNPQMSGTNPFAFDPCLNQSSSFNFDPSLDLTSDDLGKVQFSSDLDFTNCLFEPDALEDFAFPSMVAEEPDTPTSAASSTSSKAVETADLAFTTLSSLYACEKSQTRVRTHGTPRAALDAIMTENEKALATVDNLLETPSPYLASNLCFIILKVLALYASAAQLEPRRDKSQPRTVLMGLRRVEKIIDNFSERLGLCDASGDAGHEMVFVQMERMMRKVLRKTISGSTRGT